LADGSETGYYEVAELKQSRSGWRYLRGYKLTEDEVDRVAPEAISSEMVIHQGVCF
jgi:hypothetical protein